MAHGGPGERVHPLHHSALHIDYLSHHPEHNLPLAMKPSQPENIPQQKQNYPVKYECSSAESENSGGRVSSQDTLQCYKVIHFWRWHICDMPFYILNWQLFKKKKKRKVIVTTFMTWVNRHSGNTDALFYNIFHPAECSVAWRVISLGFRMGCTLWAFLSFACGLIEG